MIIDIPKIAEGGSTYQGELPPEIMDLAADKFVQPGGPISYALTAEIVSDQLIITGQLETTLKLMCAVCADFFSTSIRVSSFLRAYPLEAGQECLDLTDDIREDILLEVPNYPRGNIDAEGHCLTCGRDVNRLLKPNGEDESPPDCWGPLDNLKM